MQQTWFITGSSRGFGRALAIAALEDGDQVVASARRPEQLVELVDRYGDRVITVPLDVTDPAAARNALAAGVERFGRLDVIVNNAGYADVSPIESTDDDAFRTQFETNFWGVYNVSKAAVPILRAQGGGLVMQFSSIGGRVGGSPGIASYQAAKFAIDGFSRVLQIETAPFGVKVLVVEPSGFATDWAGASMTVHEVPDGYEQTVGAMNTRMRQNPAGPAGDPQRGAEILVQVAKRSDIPFHLPLGVNATEMAVEHGRRTLAEDEKWAAVSRSADFAEPYPAPFPADRA
ncbi:SDR family NAD(P)-dependent oxidoreductase [Plantibacter sp. YIM 135347]|uniref:SDR family NAD(P)-dependent oxidoreductase n=1 Tax=Plantibacter sp. YIM 135347 TaxID=3423919 RepID=UPI003D342235